MSLKKKLVILVSLCATLIFSTGCTALLVGSGITGTVLLGFFVSKDTEKITVLSDSTISNNINITLLRFNDTLFHRISIHVFESNVLCIGEVESREQKQEILDLIKSTEGVKQVFDEINICETYKYSLSSRIKDSNITFAIKTKSMLDRSSIKFYNYNIITYKNVVYLLGMAQSKSEMNRMLYLASHTKYVREVKNFVRIKSKTDI